MIFNMILPPKVIAPVKDPRTLLLIHGDKIEDASIHKVPLTNSGVTISNSGHFPGSKSLEFNGSGAKITFPQISGLFDGDFTFDWWEKLPPSNTGCRYSSALKTGEGLMLGNAGTRIIGASKNTTQVGWDVIKWDDVLMTDAQKWTHWAFVRSGGIAKLYKNGKRVKEGAMEKTPGGSQYLSVIGTNAGDDQPLSGLLQEFRISDVARWTSDFTPPDKPYES